MFHTTLYVFHTLAARTRVFNSSGPCHRWAFFRTCETPFMRGCETRGKEGVRNTLQPAHYLRGAKHVKTGGMTQGCLETIVKKSLPHIYIYI